PGWRVLYPKKKKQEEEEDKKETDKILPAFTEGEQGPHKPSLIEKTTQPPKSYTEATLLRAMETAGKQVDDEELRDLMKANGIGRPSTRAGIIETLFKRKYIQRRKKLILPTETGIRLIDTIQNELLKSAELTGKWEKQLRDIEAGSHSAKQFVQEMKQMVAGLVTEVRMAAYQPVISAYTASPNASTKTKKAKSKSKASIQGYTCPKCEKGQLLKGKTAYGCSQYKAGCSFRLPFAFMEKKLSDNQLLRLLQKGSTTQLKGFLDGQQKITGKVRFDDQFQLRLEPKPIVEKPLPDVLRCPKCGIGEVKKGKTAYGCSRWQSGCDYRFPFEEVRRRAGDQKLSKALVWKILQKPI
ncbi:MAG: DNA topoisomerase, partial [Bacteroidota bacterium]